MGTVRAAPVGTRGQGSRESCTSGICYFPLQGWPGWPLEGSPDTILEPGEGPFLALGTGVALLATGGTHLLDSANQVPVAEEND